MKETMRAVVNRRYGGPEVFEVAELPTPVPKAGEILVRVRAAVAGPSDSAFREGKPFLVRLLYGLRRPKFPVGGVEFAGEVVGLGSAVTRYRVGDEVFGLSPDSFGAWAEYLCVPEAKSVARKPSLSMEDAVAIVDGGATARTFLKETARLQPGQRVLVNGAAGAVGSYGVQIAKFLGAHVTGVCGTSNVDYVRSLGADDVIDYTREDFTRANAPYDVVFDAVGKSSFPECRRVLKPQGLYLTTVPTPALLVHLAGNLFRAQKAGFATAGLVQNADTLTELAQWAEAGHVWANIHQRFPLEKMADAHRLVDSGHKRGNVVLTWGATNATPQSIVR